MFYDLQIRWGGKWRTIEGWFDSREEAIEAGADWCRAFRCYGNPFRVVPSPRDPLPSEAFDHDDIPF